MFDLYVEKVYCTRDYFPIAFYKQQQQQQQQRMMQGMYYIVYRYLYVKTTLIYIILWSYVSANQNALAGAPVPRGAQGAQGGGMVQEQRTNEILQQLQKLHVEKVKLQQQQEELARKVRY